VTDGESEGGNCDEVIYITWEATAVPTTAVSTKSVDCGSGWVGSVHDF